jgi:hypothetical protein
MMRRRKGSETCLFCPRPVAVRKLKTCEVHRQKLNLKELKRYHKQKGVAINGQERQSPAAQESGPQHP